MQTLSSVHNQSWLAWFLKGILVLGGLVLIGRLLELQVIKGEYFRNLSDENRIRRIVIEAPRGEILARGGEVLVGNGEVKKKIVFTKEGYDKVPAQGGDSEDIVTEPKRIYYFGSDLGHITGYLGEVGENEVSKINSDCPEKGIRYPGTFTGRGGLEEMYECKLRGIDGEELVEVDTAGRKIRVIGRKNPVAGENIKTTIDLPLQRKVAEELKEKGAIIASDGLGQVLALYSHPSFDPNIFLADDDDSKKKVSEVLQDPDLPLFNRVLAGTYHPGSVFKLVVAVGALEEGRVSEDYRYNDEGVIKVNEFEYTNWYFTQYGGKEGEIDLKKAISRSTDTFFYKVGELLGPDNIAAWSVRFGLSQKTNIDIPGEAVGLIPSPEWKKRVKGENWFLGNTYHMAIGQGDVATTVIGAHEMTSTIASQGKLCHLHIAEDVDPSCRDLKLHRETIEIVKEGMVGACSTGGTAFPFFDFTPQVACKTGTAETDEEDKTHAWFTVFAPADYPEIVVTALVEKGGEGSKVAAPIARKVLDFWVLESNP